MFQLNRRKFVGLLGPLAASTLFKAGPDLILHNANIITIDPSHARAQAIAIFGDRILHVGTDEEVLKLKTSFTKSVNMAVSYTHLTLPTNREV